MYSGKHEHDGKKLMTLHWEYGPHGDISQGFDEIVWFSVILKNVLLLRIV